MAMEIWQVTADGGEEPAAEGALHRAHSRNAAHSQTRNEILLADL